VGEWPPAGREVWGGNGSARWLQGPKNPLAQSWEKMADRAEGKVKKDAVTLQ
jgi:hypothetical protein